MSQALKNGKKLENTTNVSKLGTCDFPLDSGFLMAFLIHFVILHFLTQKIAKKVHRSDTTEPKKEGIATKSTYFVFSSNNLYVFL